MLIVNIANKNERPHQNVFLLGSPIFPYFTDLIFDPDLSNFVLLVGSGLHWLMQCVVRTCECDVYVCMYVCDTYVCMYVYASNLEVEGTKQLRL